MSLVSIPAQQAKHVWPWAQQHIVAALDGAIGTNVQHVYADILSGAATLWLAVDGEQLIGAGVTQIFDEGSRKICEIVAWGCDDQSKCAALRETVHEYAKAQGCSVVRLVGRKGWVRALPDYKVKATIMERPL